MFLLIREVNRWHGNKILKQTMRQSARQLTNYPTRCVLTLSDYSTCTLRYLRPLKYFELYQQWVEWVERISEDITRNPEN